MRLKRFIEKIRNRDWTTLGLELVILVLGVFLGLQAQEWSLRRQADADSAEYTRRLLADFRTELWMRSFLVEYYDDVAASNERVLDALEGRAPLDDEALLVNAFRATQYIQWYASPSTYGELVSTGAVDMIRSEPARDLARLTFGARLMDNIERDGGDAPFRRAFRSHVPLDVQRTLQRTCGDRVPARGDFEALADPLDYPCDTGLSEAQVAEAVAALRGIDGLAPMLRLRVTEIATRQNGLKFNLRQIRDFLETADGP